MANYFVQFRDTEPKSNRGLESIRDPFPCNLVVNSKSPETSNKTQNIFLRQLGRMCVDVMNYLVNWASICTLECC
jgi:hypothetical protein